MPSTVKAISEVEAIISKNPYGLELQAQVMNIYENLSYVASVMVDYCLKPSRFPVIGMAVLHWIQLTLDERDYYSTHFSTGTMPIHFLLLDEIACRFPCQRSRVLDLYVKAFEKPHDMSPLFAVRSNPLCSRS